VKFLKAFGEFWYDFIIGDDWKIAVAVVLALAATLLVLKLGVFSDIGVAVFGAVAIVAAFAISLAIDVRPKSSS
jgi:hypothetical protein